MSDWTSETTAVEEWLTVSEEFTFTGDNVCSVVLRCPWSERIDVVNDVLGNNRLYPNVNCGAIASKVSIKPIGARDSVSLTNGRFVYNECLITISYETARVGKLEEDSMSGILYSETVEQIIENQTQDPRGFCWGTDALGQPLTEGPVRQLYSAAIKRTLFNMTSIPSAFWDLSGTVNQASYTSVPLGKTFSAETLLFIPGAADRTVFTNGSKGWHIPMKLAIKPDGWNKYWNPHKSGADKYDQIFDKKTNAQHKNFPPADWSTLVF